ncbi:hypothetical protein LGM65_32535 [Burkholderia anthina]|uniref:hypothetical protein n=1 Tax=Burkholderia anthina TaxID=179879 RepID=UPI001CF29064|nr:hypothetical protein [Burkholderia anthina]MCA8095535.1 hypothetical protein [Burkholderia anthina]
MQVLPDAGRDEEPLSTPDVHRKLSATLIDPPVVKTVQRWLGNPPEKPAGSEVEFSH